MSDERATLLRQRNEIDRILSFHQLAQYKPYPKQFDFHSAGADPGVRERLLIAGNQLGKTWCASFEVAMHATGMYPSWWPGVRFLKPTIGWCASNTSQGTRDTVQRTLLGNPGEHGTGAIPKASIIEIKKATHGVADSVETITVRHAPTGGISRITIKSYDQGRSRWQGASLNYVWMDEEPEDADLYSEALTRTNATGGVLLMTFTPLFGFSDVVKRFLLDKEPGTHVTTMTIDDALHYTPEQRALIVAAYRPHERDARAKGIPIMGSGLIFPIEDELIAESPLQLPDFWPRIVGMDFGWGHPTAAVWVAWDRDTDTAHIYDCYRRKEATPVVHSAVIRAKGSWPVAWPHDGNNADGRGSGITLAQQYRDLGCNMLKVRATHPPAKGQKEGEGGISLEAGLTDMHDRMLTGRLKVAKHLEDWFQEKRMYHREDGLVVKSADDLMSATRIALMMLRHAKVRQAPREIPLPGYRPTVKGVGFLG